MITARRNVLAGGALLVVGSLYVFWHRADIYVELPGRPSDDHRALDFIDRNPHRAEGRQPIDSVTLQFTIRPQTG